MANVKLSQIALSSANLAIGDYLVGVHGGTTDVLFSPPQSAIGVGDISPFQFGAIADGNSHPLSSVYATLAAAQVVYPFATSLTQQIDYCALQSASNAAFGVPGSEHGTSFTYLNKPLHLNSGRYVIGNDQWYIRNLNGGRIYGDGLGVTVLTGNNIVFGLDGCWYTHISDLSIITANSGSLPAFAIDGAGSNPGYGGTIPGHTYVTTGVQGCCFQNLLISSSSSYCMTLGLYSNNSGQGSEMQYLNLHLIGATQACYYQAGFNALDNQFIGGDFQFYSKNGIEIHTSSINVYNTSFESTFGYTQILNSGYDINIFAGGLANSCIICGCRSESMAFLFAGNWCRVIGCYFDSSLGQWAANTHYAINSCIMASPSLGSLTIPQNVRAKAFVCTVAGTTGGSEPTWPITSTTDIGGPTIVDGGVTWALLDYDLITGHAFLDPSSFSSEPFNPGRFWVTDPRYIKTNSLIITSDYTMGTATSVEDVIFVDATSGPITVTVPTREDLIPPIPVWQNSFTIIKTDNTTNAVTVQNLSPGFGNSITTDIITRGCKTYYFGTWQVGQQPCFGVLASTATRIIQTGITEYFVATTGSDSTGNGFIGSPWATLQHAMDHISTSIDTAGFLARVRIGAGTFAGVGLKSYVGGGIVEFKGAGPASTTIDNGPNDGVYNTGEPFSSIPPNGCVFYINEVKIKTTNSVANAAAIFVNIGPVTIIIGEDPDNPGVAGHVTMDSGGSTAANALVTINGPAGSFLDSATAANNITLVGNIPAYLSADLSATAVLVGAYTISGTPAYSRNFIDVSDNSELSDFGTTFSGSATGVRFAVDGSSKMDSSDSAGTRYPGNAVGTIAPGGIYTGITDFVGAIGSLPAAIQNARAFVTNATAPVFGAIPGATGAVQAPVYADGTNWRYG